MKLTTRLSIFFLVIFLCFSPFALWRIFQIHASEFREIKENTVWSEDQLIDGIVSINKGSTLAINKGVKIIFKKNSKIIVEKGILSVRGTKKEPVLFDGEVANSGYSIIVNSTGEGRIRNANIRNGGNVVSLIGSRSLMNNAYAAEYIGAFSVYGGGRLQAESCSFSDNKVAVSLKNVYGDRIKINRSSFVDNYDYDIYGNVSGVKANFNYNWWGNFDGPEASKILGRIDFNHWAKSEDFKDPVIIIPGILGSQKIDNQWQLDLIYHTYDNLYNALVKEGYVPELNLFKFPYEWRDSNVENAKIFADRIEEIKQTTNWPKVDVVAHSMGGLLAREYIESDYYRGDVDQLITLGTPHLGAPKSYISYEAGNLSIGFGNLITQHIFKQEAEKSGYDNLFDYIHGRPISSIEELLPVYDYIFDKDAGQTRVYPENYPRNYFLENLNLPAKLKKLESVEFSKIIGSIGGSESTLSGFNVINEDFGKYWEYGYPQGIEMYPMDNSGITRSFGDRTVPLLSAKSEEISSDYLIEVESSHRGLPTDAQKEVIELLTGTMPDEEVRSSLIENILFISVYSPIDIQIISPDGKIVGKDFETGELINKIDGAYYSGFDTENEFVTIPNPQDGEYKIKTQGTGAGSYRIESVLISENNETIEEADESMVVIEGEATLGETEEKSIEVSGGEVLEKTADVTPPSIVINSPENKNYLNAGSLAVDYVLEDDFSTVENIIKKIELNGETFEDDHLELPLMALGEYEMKIEAEDESGNKSDKSANFILETDLNSLEKNVDFYYEKNLIKKKAEKIFLQNQLRQIEDLIEHRNRILPHFKFYPKYQKNLEEVFNKIIHQRIELLIKIIEHQNNKKIDFSVKERLIEGLEFVKNDF